MKCFFPDAGRICYSGEMDVALAVVFAEADLPWDD